jgi:hypothetical protein
VLGGYGGFGARLSRRLAARGHRLLVAGRNAERAQAFAAELDGAAGVAADRDHDLGPLLAERRPALVIDAAGPFDRDRYAVPRACIAAGVSYLDLADGRAFVSGVGALDEAARAAGVAVVAGASSVPALSGAAVRRLAQDLDRVASVDISISASNRAGAGPSVARAMLGQVGRPVRVWRGRRWDEAIGWRELRRERYAVPGQPPLGRLLAQADVPDLDLLPARLPGRPAVAFHAGTELAWQTLALWALSWPVALGLVRSGRVFAGLAGRLQRLTARWGGDRSAMMVTLTGERAGIGVARRWTLLASGGDGPEIPTLAAVLVAERILAGLVEPGARDAGTLLELSDFDPLLAKLAVTTDVDEIPLPPALYARVMGSAFDRLPPLVRRLHAPVCDAGWAGEATVTRGRSLLARLIATTMRFPRSGTFPLHVHIRAEDHGERWTRRFADQAFTSRFTRSGPHLVERFGPLRFRFALDGDEEGLAMRFRGWSAFGLPLPRALGPRVEAREWEEAGRFRLHVAVGVPMIGPVIGYDGWLRPSEEDRCRTP